MHKARMVQKVWLPLVEQQLKAIEEAEYNTFLLKTKDVLLDMLTDNGVNAMSNNQFTAMMKVDYAYAGSALRENLQHKAVTNNFLLG